MTAQHSKRQHVARDQGGVFLHMSEVARRLDLSVSRAYTLAREGRIPMVRRGRAVRVPAGAFSAWVAAQDRAALEAMALEGPGPGKRTIRRGPRRAEDAREDI